jgi:pimeloyl-ACP methyl ester carboxylesterase
MGEDSDYRRRLDADGEPTALGAAFPQIRVEMLPDAGHMLHHERPQAVAEIVEAFLEA